MTVEQFSREEREARHFELDIFRAAMDASPHGVALFDGDSCLYTNPAWDLMMQPDDQGGTGRNQAGREIVTSTHRFDYCGTPLRLILAHDVTERKKAERQLHEAQKLEALGCWVGGVVHDFNNLLTALMLYSDMIDQVAEPDSPVARFNREINDVAKRGAGLTGQLLAFVQRRPCERTIISANSLLKGLRDILERMIGEDVQVFMDLAPACCPVKMDPAQLQQVVLNLALNARDAMPEGGRMTIRTSELDADLGGVTRKCVALAVSDTGHGMDASTLEHIFEPFFTTKPHGKGTGLGLTIVQRTIADVGGKIDVDSKVGAGTTITVIIPRTEPPARREGISSVHGAWEAGSETLLVVEDDSAVRSSIVATLIERGYEVLEAANGPDALALADASKCDIHLLITDLVLPGISGRELARRMSKKRPHVRVLFVSGYGVRPADSCSNEVVFEKPFRSDALAARVRQALAQTEPTSTNDSSGR